MSQISINFKFIIWYEAVVAEWLRRLTRNQIPSGSVGSSPTDREMMLFTFPWITGKNQKVWYQLWILIPSFRLVHAITPMEENKSFLEKVQFGEKLCGINSDASLLGSWRQGMLRVWLIWVKFFWKYYWCNLALSICIEY